MHHGTSASLTDVCQSDFPSLTDGSEQLQQDLGVKGVENVVVLELKIFRGSF